MKLLAALVLTLVPTLAGAEPFPKLETNVVEVALWKNGLGVFTRDGAMPERPGRYEISVPSTPVHGTFWVTAPIGATVTSVVSEEMDGPLEQADLLSVLRANKGRRVELQLHDKGVVAGLLSSMAQPRASAFVPQIPGATFVVETDGGVEVIAAHEISRVSFPGTSAAQLQARGRRLSVTFGRVAPGRFVVTYAAKGVTWAPAMRFDLGDDGHAHASASAVVVTERESLEDARIHLITGVPSLRFADVASPLAAASDLAGFLRALAQSNSHDNSDISIAGGVMSQNTIGNVYGETRSAEPTYGAATAGITQEDLHLHPLEHVTLGATGRGWYPLMTEKVPFEHVYKWDVPDAVGEANRYEERKQGPENGAWHCVRVTNTTSIPWTTSPAETRKDGVLLGQGVLAFTPRGVARVVPITRAMGIRTDARETEVSRIPEQTSTSTHRVTLHGVLEIENTLPRAITLEITKHLSGNLHGELAGADVTKLSRGLSRRNPQLEIRWKLPLASGEMKTLEYTYDTLVPR